MGTTSTGMFVFVGKSASSYKLHVKTSLGCWPTAASTIALVAYVHSTGLVCMNFSLSASRHTLSFCY